MLPVMYGKRRRDSFTIMISTISSAVETSPKLSLVVSDEARAVHSTIRSLFSGFWISKKAIAYGFFQSPAKCDFCSYSEDGETWFDVHSTNGPRSFPIETSRVSQSTSERVRR